VATALGTPDAYRVCFPRSIIRWDHLLIGQSSNAMALGVRRLVLIVRLGRPNLFTQISTILGLSRVTIQMSGADDLGVVRAGVVKRCIGSHVHNSNVCG